MGTPRQKQHKKGRILQKVSKPPEPETYPGPGSRHSQNPTSGPGPPAGPPQGCDSLPLFLILMAWFLLEVHEPWCMEQTISINNGIYIVIYTYLYLFICLFMHLFFMDPHISPPRTYNHTHQTKQKRIYIPLWELFPGTRVPGRASASARKSSTSPSRSSGGPRLRREHRRPDLWLWDSLGDEGGISSGSGVPINRPACVCMYIYIYIYSVFIYIYIYQL